MRPSLLSDRTQTNATNPITTITTITTITCRSAYSTKVTMILTREEKYDLGR
jgi:hypothetical protein